MSQSSRDDTLLDLSIGELVVFLEGHLVPMSTDSQNPHVRELAEAINALGKELLCPIW